MESVDLAGGEAAASSWRLAVAPMLGWTDRHFRYLVRLLSRHVRLYSEMVVAAHLHRSDPEKLLAFSPEERPLALQLAGNDPELLAAWARLGERFGYDEINLNVGCPSSPVQKGRFGAYLMLEPDRVADCIAAMREAVSIPVTVKCRIGVDQSDGYDPLRRFVEKVADGGCRVFIVHARKAWLKGLSPKENRSVPPLRYDLVYRLKRERPDLTVVLNGGVTTLGAAEEHLAAVDGVMIGRAAYHNPYLLAEADRRLFGTRSPPLSREELLARFLPYIRRQLSRGERFWSIGRHLLGLYHGQPGAKRWRRLLTERGRDPEAGLRLLEAWLRSPKSAIV